MIVFRTSASVPIMPIGRTPAIVSHKAIGRRPAIVPHHAYLSEAGKRPPHPYRPDARKRPHHAIGRRPNSSLTPDILSGDGKSESLIINPEGVEHPYTPTHSEGRGRDVILSPHIPCADKIHPIKAIWRGLRQSSPIKPSTGRRPAR